MKAAFIFTLTIILLSTEALSLVKNPFELIAPPFNIHTITDCMHVTSETGDFVFKKIAQSRITNMNKRNSPDDIQNLIEDINPMTVCGLYVIGEPDTIIEITMKHIDVNCESGGLMGFVDGWELNGQYFPGEKDHSKKLEDRIVEFCNDYTQWPIISHKKTFRSSQNAALLQYRIPIRGSFIASVHFHKLQEPCNILVQDTPAIYTLRNYGHHRNCTLTTIFPTVVSLMTVNIGSRTENHNKEVNYECEYPDHLDIGGSSGLDSYDMEKSNSVCGHTERQGPEQAIFCGITSIRLVSSGKYDNIATLLIRQAEENDLDISTLICPL